MFWEIPCYSCNVSNPQYKLRFLAPKTGYPVNFTPFDCTQIDIHYRYPIHRKNWRVERGVDTNRKNSKKYFRNLKYANL